MATAAELLTAMAAKIEEEVEGAVRSPSDYRVDLAKIPAGATRYQLRMGPAGVSVDSNSTRTVLGGELAVFHRLADKTDERTYTEGAMQTTIDALVNPSTWRSLVECKEVVEDPSYSVQRVVHVISTVISLQLSIA